MAYETVTRLSEPRTRHGHYTKETVHATAPGSNQTLCGVWFRLGERGSIEWLRYWGDKTPTCRRCLASISRQ
jgi:hypothetical protein